ncbi:MAG: hypothetical protein K8T20_03300 [Planctomycetes bacterium]|nr:hypothetical protein [Planctomycetota bacterium]
MKHLTLILLALATAASARAEDPAPPPKPSEVWTAFRAAIDAGEREKAWACLTPETRTELTTGKWGEAFRLAQKQDDEDAVTVATNLGYKDAAEFKKADAGDLAWHIVRTIARDLGWLAPEIHLVVTAAGEKSDECRFEHDDKLSGWLVMAKVKDVWKIDLAASRELTVRKGLEEDARAHEHDGK